MKPADAHSIQAIRYAISQVQAAKPYDGSPHDRAYAIALTQLELAAAALFYHFAPPDLPDLLPEPRPEGE